MRVIEATHVAQLDPFELVPEAFVRVQLGGIGREAFQVHPSRGAIGQELLDDVTAVNGGAIPNDHHAAGHLAQQVFKKGHDVGRMEGTLLAVKIHLAFGGYGRDSRQMVSRPPLPQHGRLPDRGIGTPDTGQGIKAGLVYEEDGLVLGVRPLLRAGQMSLRQRVMATASRWRARRTGFCGLQRIALQRRPTWVGW